MKEEIKPMMLITSSWEGQRTFKMMPLLQNCLYNECIYDPTRKVLAIISKEYKNNLQLISSLDDFGAATGKKERVMMDTYYEYFIENKDEIIMFINKLCINSDTYNYKRILENEVVLD